MVKNLPASAGDVRDAGLIPELGRSLEEGMATHSSVLAWRIPRTEEPGGLHAVHGVTKSRTQLSHVFTELFLNPGRCLTCAGAVSTRTQAKSAKGPPCPPSLSPSDLADPLMGVWSPFNLLAWEADFGVPIS